MSKKRMLVMLRAGLDPQRRVALCESPDGTVETGSAVEAAVCSGKPGVLAMLRPSPELDDAEHLVGCSMLFGERPMLQGPAGSRILHKLREEGRLSSDNYKFRWRQLKLPTDDN